MEIISNPTQAEIRKAAKALKEGHLVAFPTETVYGLGADANNEKAVSRVYSVKGRPTGHPLIVHISSTKQLDKWVREIPEYAIQLAEKFWPGPMTLILKRSVLAKDYVTGGQDNVGIRIPGQALALALLSEFESLGGQGVAAPSANRFGAVSATTKIAVEYALGKYLHSSDQILDGGSCNIGLESTIIDCTNANPSVLRPGPVTIEMLEELLVLKYPLGFNKAGIRASGLMKSHYSPTAKVVLGTKAKAGDGFIALSNLPTPIGAIRLASPLTSREFARDLYEALRIGDHLGVKKIVIVEPSGEGIAAAIRDRLQKSAAQNDPIT